MPFVNRTLATLRRAEFGFLGVTVFTCTHTPRRWGQPGPRVVRFRSEFWTNRSAGALVRLRIFVRPFLTSWLTVGKLHRFSVVKNNCAAAGAAAGGQYSNGSYGLSREIRLRASLGMNRNQSSP